MKLLIAYVSKTGSSRYCAELLAKELPDNVTTDIVDLENTASMPDIAMYDAAVIGGPVRFGVFAKTVRKFLKNNVGKLSSIPCAVFFCCGISRNSDEYSETITPRKLHASLGVHHFGGELKPEKASGMDKLFIKHLRSSIKSFDFEDSDCADVSLPELVPENVLLLAKSIKELCR